MDWQFEILGDTRLLVDDQPAPLGPSARVRGMLAMLLLHARRTVSFRMLRDVIWDDDDLLDDERGTMQTYVSRLRAQLKKAGVNGSTKALLAWRNGGYVLDVDPSLIDFYQFRSLYEHGRAAAERDQHDNAVQLLRQAVALWRGEPLSDLRTKGADQIRQDMIQDELMPARCALVDSELALRRYDEALVQLKLMLREYGHSERVIKQQMKALAGAGRHPEIADFYRQAHRRLRNTFGVDPSSELQSFVSELLQQRPASGSRSSPPPSIQPGGARVASESPLPKQLPPDVRDFTGRDSLVAMLDHLVPNVRDGRPPTVNVIAVDGPPGIGKTTLVTHWAHRVSGAFPDGQLYVDLRGYSPEGEPIDPDTALVSLLDALGAPVDQLPPRTADRTARWRTVTSGKRLLVFLDNARSVDQVRPLLPAEPGCLVVVTSRNRLTGLLQRESAYHVAVTQMSLPESRELLARMIGPSRVDHESEALHALAAQCDGVPLALRISGGKAITRAHMTLAELAEHLAHHREHFEIWDSDEYSSSLRAAFSWSYHLLHSESQRAFRLLGLHPGRDISVPAAAALFETNNTRAVNLLEVLTGEHLIEYSIPEYYRLHDLLRSYAAHQCELEDSKPERYAAVHRVVDFYLGSALRADRRLASHRAPVPDLPILTNVIPLSFADDHAALNWSVRERPNLIAAAHSAARYQFHRHTWRLAAAVREIIERQDHPDTNLALHTLALESALASVEREGVGVAGTLNNRGLAQLQVGQHSEALASFQEAQREFQRLGHTVFEATCIHNRALAHTELGDTATALDLYEQALAIRRTLPNRSGQAATLHRLADLHHRLGHHREAETHYTEALALRTAIADVRGKGATLAALGALLHDRAENERAIDYLEKALAAYRDTQDRRGAARALSLLAEAHRAMNHPVKAADYQRQAEELHRRIGSYEIAFPSRPSEPETASNKRHYATGHNPPPASRSEERGSPATERPTATSG